MYTRDQAQSRIPPTVTVGRTRFFLHINTETGPKASKTADHRPRRTLDAKPTATAKVRSVNDAEAVGRAAAARAAANAAVIERLQARNVAARGAK